MNLEFGNWPGTNGNWPGAAWKLAGNDKVPTGGVEQRVENDGFCFHHVEQAEISQCISRISSNRHNLDVDM